MSEKSESVSNMNQQNYENQQMGNNIEFQVQVQDEQHQQSQQPKQPNKITQNLDELKNVNNGQKNKQGGDHELEKLFNQHDIDKDGKLNPQEVTKLLKAKNIEIYEGSVSKICRKLCAIQNNDLNYNQCLINYHSFQQYYRNLSNQLDLKIWKNSLLLKHLKLSSYSNCSQEFISKNKPQSLKLKILVGEQKEKYKNQILIDIEKKVKKKKKNSSVKKQNIPIIFLTIATQNQNSAEVVVQELNTIVKYVQTLIQEEFKFCKQIFEQTKIEIIKQGNKVKLTIESNNDKCNNLLRQYIYLLDSLFQCQNIIDIKMGLNFDCDLTEFNKNKGKTIDQIICNNFLFKLQLKISDCIGNWKQYLRKNQFFSDLIYDNTDSQILSSMVFFSTEFADLSFKFKNLSELQDNLQLDVLGQLFFLESLNQLLNLINNPDGMPVNLTQILVNLTGPINLSAKIDEININIKLDIWKINQVLTKPLIRYSQNDQ